MWILLPRVWSAAAVKYRITDTRTHTDDRVIAHTKFCQGFMSQGNQYMYVRTSVRY